MTQVNQSGMRLRLADKSRNHGGWIMETGISFLACTGFVLSIGGLVGFMDDAVIAVMLAAALVCSLVWGLMRKADAESWFYIGALAVILLLVLIFRKQIFEGFRMFWNQAGDAMVQGIGWVMPELELQMSANQGSFSVALFGAVLTGFISVICCLLTAMAPAVLAAMLDLNLMMGLMLFGGEGTWGWVLAVLAVSLMVLVYSGWKREGSSVPVLMSWILCAVLAGFLLVFVSETSLGNWVSDISEQLHESIHETKYETKYTSLPEGDFSDYRNRTGKAQPALAVTMEEPQRLYLRGFTGAEFTGESWEPLNWEALAKNKDLLYWMNLNAFDQNAQFDAAAANVPVTRSTVTIQNMGACSYYLYVPFNITEGFWTKAENLNADGVLGEGERNYVYSVISDAETAMMQVLSYLQTTSDSAALTYRKAESGYRQFVSHYYLQFPEEAKELLMEHWNSVASQYGSAANLTLQQAQECALLFLSECFPEEGTPEDWELPLDMASGTTYQYTTVAVLTLRYFGIPARYAEGYVITEEMAEQAEPGETITVDSSCARAWVEVYQDGIGWIPMDLTPGIDEMLVGTNQDSQSNKNSSSSKNTTQKKEEEPEEKEVDQPEPDGGSQVRILVKTVLTALLVVLLALLAVFLILWLRRKLLIQARDKKFRSVEIKDGVAWIFADTVALLERLGFNRGNGSVRTLVESFEAKYGEELATQFVQMIDLNDRALFSTQVMEESEREVALTFHSWTIGKLNSEVKWYTRLWFKWALCLY